MGTDEPQGGHKLPVDRAALAGMAGDAEAALKALRPGNKPSPRRRTATGKPACEIISVRLKVVTPILGGGPKLRALDKMDIIRVPTVRGHLRFWWRALYGHLFDSAQQLYEAESALWGRAADDKGGRSEVDVSITLDKIQTQLDERDPRHERVEGGYALWTAGSQQDGTPSADRRQPGTIFTLRIFGPAEVEIAGRKLRGEEVLSSTVRAWILFGGYGSRTRRGLGSLIVDGDENERRKWLPNLVADADEQPTAEELASNLFGMRHFKGPILKPEKGRAGRDLPQLSNALFCVDLDASTKGAPGSDAVSAWTTALGWLRSFRQDVGTGARRPGNGHPGRSNWPEADKIRHHYGSRFAHRARKEHGAAMAWPRAGFGLPIVGEIRGNNEPGKYTLRWKSARGQHDRLASPLILKALPLANGNFLACALWLDRGLPDGALVGLEGDVTENGKIIKGVKAGTEAPFHRSAPAGSTDHPLLAPKDTPLFAPLSRKATLRNAFCDWLVSNKLAQRVAP
jgi:CRISPR-associated protein Cmr1